MKDQNPTPNPERKPANVDDLARREAEANAAMEAALSENMDPKEASERNLRTSNAALIQELRNSIQKLLTIATGLVVSIGQPLNDYLNKAVSILLAKIEGLKADLDKSLADTADDIVTRICQYIFKMTVIVIVSQIVIAAAVVFILRK